MARAKTLSEQYDAKVGPLSRGCRECIKGNKTVLFVTGVCSKHCYYCPLSEEKWLKDDVYANEWKIDHPEELIKEIELCNSTGVGITGGDPLTRIKKTVDFIILLKKTFGKNFHIHLYTVLELLTKEKLAQLHTAGLDEIRVHPDLEDKKLWKKIDLLALFDWDCTVEIPVVPSLKQETLDLMKYCDKKIKYMNLNELEMSHTNADALKQRNFALKEQLSHGVYGSQELAHYLLDWAEKNVSYSVHYCSSQTKDRQMGKRIKKRVKNVIQPFDLETDVGTIIRGSLYLEEWKPGHQYSQHLNSLKPTERKKIVLRLQNKLSSLYKLGIPKKLLQIDEHKVRIITSVEIAEQLAPEIKQLGLLPAFVEEYPTHDALEVQVQFF